MNFITKLLSSHSHGAKLISTNIEPLEKVAKNTDSVVLVPTPDEIITSLEKERLTPRKNVVFKL